MGFDWIDKVDGEDVVFAKDVNDLAHAIKTTLSAINKLEETMKDSVHNLVYGIETYVNDDNALVTDDSGIHYLSYSGSFENGAYLYQNFVVDNFRRKPKTETTLELIFNVASRHIAVDDCDSGGLNVGETDVLITYTDKTTATFGQSYYTATNTGDKTITINGTSATYQTTEFDFKFQVTKEIESISFRIVSDNYYTDGDPTGNVCEQKTLIQSAVGYDDECVVARKELTDFAQVIETELDGKAPKNHASNGTGFGKGTRTVFGHVKLSEAINSSTGADAGIAVAPKAVKTISDTLSTEISERQVADDELKGKIEYGESERQAIIEDINELENSKVGSNDRVTGKEMNYSVTELLKWVAEGVEKSNSVNYPGFDYIISDVYEMYNALCSYGFQEPIEVVKTVAELKKQAENK